MADVNSMTQVGIPAAVSAEIVANGAAAPLMALGVPAAQAIIIVANGSTEALMATGMSAAQAVEAKAVIGA